MGAIGHASGGPGIWGATWLFVWETYVCADCLPQLAQLFNSKLEAGE